MSAISRRAYMGLRAVVQYAREGLESGAFPPKDESHSHHRHEIEKGLVWIEKRLNRHAAHFERAARAERALVEVLK